MLQTPIKLKLFALDPQAYGAFLLRYKAGAMIPQFVVILLLGILEYVVTQSVLGSVGLVVYLESLSILARWSSIRKAVRNPLNKELWTNRALEFDSETIRWATSSGTSTQAPLRNFGKAEQYGGYIILYLTTSQFFPIPESAFELESDKAALLNILTSSGALKPKAKK